MTTELVTLDSSRSPIVLTTGSRRFKLILATVFKRWRMILAVLAVVTVPAAIWFLYVRPPQRTASARILVKADRTALAISGVTGPGAHNVSPLEILRSEVDLITSRDVLFPVARVLPPAEGLLDPLKRLLRFPERTPDEKLERTWQSLVLNTTALLISETNTIQVTYWGQSAEEAVRTLQLILDQYLRLHARESSGSVQLVDYYTHEHDRLTATLRGHEQALESWREANGLLSIDGEIARQLSVVADLERGLNQTDADIEATKARIQFLAARLQPQPDRLVVSQDHIPNPVLTAVRTELATGTHAPDIDRDPVVVKLREELVSAEVQLQDALQRYTEKDRRVQEKQEKIALVKQELSKAERAAGLAVESRSAKLAEVLRTGQEKNEVIGRETIALNPLKEELKREMTTAEAQLTALASRRGALGRQLAETARQRTTLNANQTEGLRLHRLVAASQDAFLAYAKKLEEARMTAGLEKALVTTVSVVEQPYATPDFDLLRRLGLLILASVVGLWLGLGVAFGAEFVRPSLRIPEDVEHYLALPILAAVPQFEAAPRTLQAQPRARKE